MKKFFFVLTAFLLGLLCPDAYAQFYDADDEIYFYQSTTEGSNDAYVFNFDGRKATSFGFNTSLAVKSHLKENRNYYEGKVYEEVYDMKYREDLSSPSWTVYSQYRTGWLGSWTNFWYFSKDRKTMIHRESGGKGEWTYRLVDKDYYIEEGRRRSNVNDRVIYE